jgi:hypothetical protein
MGESKIIFLDTFIENLASVSFFIESQGLPETAVKYKNRVYDFIEKLDFDIVDYPICRNQHRAVLGLKCIQFKNKYTIVFHQYGNFVIITEFIPSKLII